MQLIISSRGWQQFLPKEGQPQAIVDAGSREDASMAHKLLALTLFPLNTVFGIN
jgi:hypothetical protein